MRTKIRGSVSLALIAMEPHLWLAPHALGNPAPSLQDELFVVGRSVFVRELQQH